MEGLDLSISDCTWSHLLLSHLLQYHIKYHMKVSTIELQFWQASQLRHLIKLAPTPKMDVVNVAMKQINNHGKESAINQKSSCCLHLTG